MNGKRTAAALVATIALALGPTTGAVADDGHPSEQDSEVFTASAPMNIVGYDVQIAEANGYRIETDENGTQHSVPVTPRAIAEQAEEEPLMQARGTVYGNCGTSSLTGYKGPLDTVYFTTSYSVSGVVISYDWRVNANGFITGNYWSTSGTGGSSSRSWSGAIGGVIGWGTASVPAASSQASVIKSNGAVCWSGGPSFEFE